MGTEDKRARLMAKNCVCFVTRKAARCIAQQYDESLRPTGLRSTQLAVLNTVRLLEPVNIVRLAGALVLDRTTPEPATPCTKRPGPSRIRWGFAGAHRAYDPRRNGQAGGGNSILQKAQEKVEKNLRQQGLESLRGTLSELVSLKGTG